MRMLMRKIQDIDTTIWVQPGVGLIEIFGEHEFGDFVEVIVKPYTLPTVPDNAPEGYHWQLVPDKPS